MDRDNTANNYVFLIAQTQNLLLPYPTNPFTTPGISLVTSCLKVTIFILKFVFSYTIHSPSTLTTEFRVRLNWKVRKTTGPSEAFFYFYPLNYLSLVLISGSKWNGHWGTWTGTGYLNEGTWLAFQATFQRNLLWLGIK